MQKSERVYVTIICVEIPYVATGIRIRILDSISVYILYSVVPRVLYRLILCFDSLYLCAEKYRCDKVL